MLKLASSNFPLFLSQILFLTLPISRPMPLVTRPDPTQNHVRKKTKLTLSNFQGRLYFSFKRSITFSIGLRQFPPSYAEIWVSRLEVHGLSCVALLASLEKGEILFWFMFMSYMNVLPQLGLQVIFLYLLLRFIEFFFFLYSSWAGHLKYVGDKSFFIMYLKSHFSKHFIIYVCYVE